MKNRRFARSLIVMVFAIVALAIGGCNSDNDDITGGGWILKNSGKKANFAFNFKCKCDDDGLPKVSGQLQFNDREAGVRFHGVADSLDLAGTDFADTCDGLLNKWGGHYFGSYTPQPRKLGEGGRFEIYVEDKGERGPSKGDNLTLNLTGGIHSGYTTKGALEVEALEVEGGNVEGGNIQAHGAKTRE